VHCLLYLVLDVLVRAALEEVSVEDAGVVQRGGVVQRRAALLVLGPRRQPVLLRDELDDLGLVEEHGLVEGRGAVLVAGQRDALRRQQLLHHGQHAGRHRVVQDRDHVLGKEKPVSLMHT